MTTNGLFVKGKGQVLTEYLRARRKVGSAVAARGFSWEPGFMYDAHNDLEIDIKMQLTELNYNILQEALARELKQYGLEYDLAHKNAVIAWEIEKQGLLDDWNRELSWMKREDALQEHELRLLAIEVSRRAILMIEAKAEIALEIEGLQQQMAQLDGTTGDYEVQLAQAKILTAQKKLETLPYIEQIIAVEREILAKNYQLVGKSMTIAEKAAQVLTWDQTLVGRNFILLGKIQEMAGKELLIVAKEEQVVAKNIEILKKENELVEALSQVADKNTELAEKSAELAEKESDIVGKMVEVANKNAEIAVKSEALVSKEETISGKLQTIADRNKTLVDSEDAIADKESDLLTTLAEVITAEGLVIDEREKIIEPTEELIAVETANAQKRESKVTPALTSLIDVMEGYVVELAVQQELYDNIAALKTEIADEKNIQAEKHETILTTKRLLTQTIDDLITELGAFIDYKKTTLNEAIASLIAANGLYEDEIINQVNYRIAIANSRKAIADLGPSIMAKEHSVASRERQIEEARQDLAEASAELSAARSLHKVGVAEAERDNYSAYVTALGETQTALAEARETADTDYAQFKFDAATEAMDIDVDIKSDKIDAESANIVTERREQTHFIQQEAALRAGSKVTAGLIHLLKQG